MCLLEKGITNIKITVSTCMKLEIVIRTGSSQHWATAVLQDDTFIIT